MKCAAAILALTAAACIAATTLSQPLVGVVRDPAGRFRKVYGAAGAFVLGPPEAVALAPRTIGAARLEEQGKHQILVVPDTTGAERRVALPRSAGALQAVADGWLAAYPFLIRVAAKGVTIYRLPEPPR